MNVEKGYCHPTALTKSTIVWEPEIHCQIFEMLSFDAYMVKYKEKYWTETNTDWALVQKLNERNKNKTAPNSNTQIATRFEVNSKPEFYCGSTKHLYPTEYEDLFIIYEHGFEMNTGKPYDTDINTFDNKKFIKINNTDISQQPNKTKNHNNYCYYGFVIEITHQEMQMDLYMSKKIYSQLSLQAIEFYSKLCEQTRNIRQLALIQVHKDTPLLGYILTGDRSIFVQEEGKNVKKMYRCAKKVSQRWVPDDKTCYDKIPILYKGVVQYVHQLTRKTYAWAKKVPCSHNNFDQLISIDIKGTVRYRLTPFPIKVETILHTISLEEIRVDNLFSRASLIENGIFSKEQLIKERERDLLREYFRDRSEPLHEATSANGQKLLEIDQLGLLDAYKRYENSLKWLKDLKINGYNFQIDQPTIKWKEKFDGKGLKHQIKTVFGWPLYILEKIAILYAMGNFLLIIFNVIINFYNAFAIHKAIGKQVSLTRILLSGIF